jgi:hypothetical protein
MSTTPSRNIIAAVLGGALMLVATPVAAHAQSSEGVTVTPFAANDGKVGLRDHKSQKYLEPLNAGTAQGTKVVQQTQRPLVNGDLDARQNWAITPVGQWYVFKNVKTGKALGLNNGSASKGTVLITATADGSTNQDWQFRTVTAYPNGVYHLVNAKDITMCVGIVNASTSDSAQAAIFPCDTTNNQGWEVVDPA